MGGLAIAAQILSVSGLGPALPRSAAIKTSPKAPAGSAHWFWQRPLPQGNPLYAVSFADPNTEIAVGEDATILRTTDGGAHWTIKTSGYEGAGVELFGVSFSDASHGTAVGSNFFFSGGGNAVVLRRRMVETPGSLNIMIRRRESCFSGHPFQMQMLAP